MDDFPGRITWTPKLEQWRARQVIKQHARQVDQCHGGETHPPHADVLGQPIKQTSYKQEKKTWLSIIVSITDTLITWYPHVLGK